MSISMIRGYGLPSDAASMYNGYAGPAQRPVVLPYTPPSLFQTLPDPQLGSYDAFGINILGTGRTAFSVGPGAASTDPVGGTAQQPSPPQQQDFMGLAVLALGAVGLYFLMKK